MGCSPFLEQSRELLGSAQPPPVALTPPLAQRDRVKRLDAGALAEDLGDDPVLLLAERARLGDLDGVADLALIVLVVHLESPRRAHRTAVERVAAEAVHRHYHGLLHLV